jgi:bidirectional [NiFe] hydrogenase diaphorase subunit
LERANGTLMLQSWRGAPRTPLGRDRGFDRFRVLADGKREAVSLSRATFPSLGKNARISTLTPARATGGPHPSGDNRFKMLDATMRRHRYEPDALLEVLHAAQERFGYLEVDVLFYIGRCLKVPPSRVYGVATFYNLFSLKPKGAHTCVVCMGTACYVKGTAAILSSIEMSYGIKAGETTADGTLSLVTARCLGACGLAPAVVFDNDVAGRVTADGTLQRLRTWTGHER